MTTPNPCKRSSLQSLVEELGEWEELEAAVAVGVAAINAARAGQPVKLFLDETDEDLDRRQDAALEGLQAAADLNRQQGSAERATERGGRTWTREDLYDRPICRCATPPGPTGEPDDEEGGQP